jgi:hypothetical protein
MHNDSYRQLRDRHRDLAELADRISQDNGGTARRLVQIYDGGAIPTGQPGKFFLTHPVEMDGDEAEGGTYWPTADTTQTIPVVILGTGAAAGDLVVAHAIGGRWVAERRGGSGFVVCNSCDIPQTDLTITVAGTGTFAGDNFTETLQLGVGPLVWETPVVFHTFPGPTPAWFYWDMGCVGSQITIRYYLSNTSSSGPFQLKFSTNTGDSGGGVTIMTQDSVTCGSMFDGQWHTCAAGNCAIGEWTWEVSA